MFKNHSLNNDKNDNTDSDQWLDGDSITDYQEVYGYKVYVATSFDSQGNPIMREKLMHGNPLQAYKQSNGAWTDTDEDNIPDIVEIIFSNTTLLDTEWRTTQPSLGGKSPEQYLNDNNLYMSYASLSERFHR